MSNIPNLELYKEKLVDIADAIRSKNGEVAEYTLEQMPSKIMGMNPRGYTKIKSNGLPIIFDNTVNLYHNGSYSSNDYEGDVIENRMKEPHIYTIPREEMDNISNIKINGRLYAKGGVAKRGNTSYTNYNIKKSVGVGYGIFFEKEGTGYYYNASNNSFGVVGQNIPVPDNTTEGYYPKDAYINWISTLTVTEADADVFKYIDINDYVINVASIISTAKSGGYSNGTKLGYSRSSVPSKDYWNGISDYGIIIVLKIDVNSNYSISFGQGFDYGHIIVGLSPVKTITNIGVSSETITKAQIEAASPQIEINFK